MSDAISSDPGACSNKWNLIQFGLLCCYSAGLYGSISLPYYVFSRSVIFLLAYYILLVLICIPICYIQIKLGAVYKRGIVGIFSHLIPLLKGGGVAILALTYIRCLTNGVELSYSLFYAFVSFDKPYDDSTHPSHSELGESKFPFAFFSNFLQKSQGIGDGGSLVWYIVLCLLFTWTAIFFLTFKGTAFLGKTVYVIVPLALFMIIVVFGYGHGTTLPEVPVHASNFKHYTVIRERNNTDFIIEDDVEEYATGIFTELLSPRPWLDALVLHMHSVGLWSGVLPTLGSQMYNRKIIINATWMILLLVYSTLPLAIVFAFYPYYDEQSHVGFLSYTNGIKPGLSFILVGLFGKARHVPGISLCIYLSIFLLGLLHQAVHLITIWDALLSSMPTFVMRLFRRQEYLISIVCGVSFLLSLPYTSQGGIFVYIIVNSYVDRILFTLIIISIVPFITGYIKQEYLYLPIERACMSLWYGLASLIPAIMLIYYFAVYVYPYPVVSFDDRWAEQMGWFIATMPMCLGLVLGAIHAVAKEKGSLKQRCIQALKTDSLRTTDSTTECETSDTGNTAIQPAKSTGEKEDKIATEIVLPPPEQSEVAKV